VEKDEIIHTMLRDAGVGLEDRTESEFVSDASDGSGEKEVTGGKRAWSF
jgi:hypothetical protein